MEISLILILALPFLGSLLAALLPANARNAEAWLAGSVAAAVAALVVDLYPQMQAAGGVLQLQIPWALGLDFSLRLDGFSWLFALLVSVMGLLVVIYARYYMSPADPVPRFFSFFLVFMGAMLGVVLSGQLIQLVLFWEMTSLSSFMLIAYWHHRQEARQGARMALLVTGLGGLALFAGVLILGHIAGGYQLDTVLAAAERIQTHPWYPVVLVLIALGALTKSAQFPFHFWLPHAMSAPTPVSAYLHSATMVKAGVYLLARLWPVLAGSDAWFWLIGGAGLASLVVAAWLAMFQRDMKGVLAYSTISHLGLITLLLGMNSELALVASVFHIINHATFKATLFMAAGIVDHETGTRDLQRLSGLARAMPLTAALATVAAAAMAGVPLLNGFLSKEMFFAETVFLDRPEWQHILLPLMATLAGVFSVAYSLRLIYRVFFGTLPPPGELPHTPSEPTRWMLLPSALLVLACVLVGIFPQQVIGGVLHSANQALLGAATPAYSLKTWHGFTAPLLMSGIALLGGVLFFKYVLMRHAPCAADANTQSTHATRFMQMAQGSRFDGRQAFNFLLQRLTSAATSGLRRLSSERLQMQLLLVLTVCLSGVLLVLLSGLDGARALSRQPAAAQALPLDPGFALLWVVGGVCALAVAWQAKYHRLAAVIFAGGAGLATSLTFVWFSAPDLALTQLAVEVVTTVLILLGLRWLPRRDKDLASPTERRLRLRHARDIVLAACSGLGLAALSYAVLMRPAEEGLATFFLQQALPQGGGQNVVNVILVDFRGFDTFGEISVLGVVALTVYALLRRFRPAPESVPLPRQQREQNKAHGQAGQDTSALLPSDVMRLPALLVRLLLPLALLVSLFMLLRGHDAPGGGFVGGLVLATAVILQYLVGGTLWVESRLRIRPLYWIASGLLAAALAGLLALLGAQPFLTSLSWQLELPWLGAMRLSSVLLFDIGVYLLVVGATVLMLVAIAHQSLRNLQYKLAATESRGE
jgi:multicomponent K+:H+ antiporter subunit A